MAAMKKFEKLAKTFMDVVHSETGLDVIIFDARGRIVFATEKSRVNDIHPGAVKLMQGESKELFITDREARGNPLMREGYGRSVIIDGEKIGGFGITGSLETTRPLGRMAARIMESWLDDFTLFNELEERVRERTSILKQEIDAREAAEKILKENQARFEAFTKAIPDILFVFDQDGRYVEIFTSSEDLLVDDLSELKGKRIQEVLPRGVASLHQDIIQEIIETGKGRFFEYQLEVPRGIRWFESRSAPIIGLDQEKKLVAASVRDITQRKLAEKEIREKEKLSVVFELAGGICHEFSQPLQIITGSCELLNTYTDLDPEISRIIARILEQAQRMGELNKNMMNITSYKTKTYLESKIIDIDKSAGT